MAAITLNRFYRDKMAFTAIKIKLCVTALGRGKVTTVNIRRYINDS